jgi:archaemetzincin
VIVFAIAPAGEVDLEAIEYAGVCLGAIPGVTVRRLEPFPPYDETYDPARGQYSSTLILQSVQPLRPPEASRLLVLTEHDIFIPMLSFVYGQAQLGGHAAVLSFARLRQEFYSLPPNRPLFLLRVRKEVLHESGHTLGLTHCEDRLCTMSLSTNIQQLDAKGSGYCDDCAVLIREGVAAAGRSAGASIQPGGIR